jgi:hypothetical protein
MKRLRTLTGLLAICGASVFMTGCGGDDDDNGGPAGPAQNAPNAVGGTYSMTDAGGSRTLTLATAGTSYTFTLPAGGTESGNFQASRSGDVWTVLTTTDDLTTTRTITLTFNAASAGAYTIEEAGQPTISGNFNRTNTPPGNNNNNTTGDATTTADSGGDATTTADSGGDATTTADSGGDATTTADSGGDATTTADSGGDTTTTTGDVPGTFPAPAALQRVDITNTTSGTGPSAYTVELNGTTSGTFTITAGSVGQGTFTYTPSGNSARLVLTYTDFVGDSDDMTLNFQAASGSSTPSNHTGSQVVSGTTYPISGTFTYVAR